MFKVFGFLTKREDINTQDFIDFRRVQPDNQDARRVASPRNAAGS